jgi:hypothetical protein
MNLLYLEDGPEVTDTEQEKDQGEVLENMYTPGSSSAEQIRRRAKAPS